VPPGGAYGSGQIPRTPALALLFSTKISPMQIDHTLPII